MSELQTKSVKVTPIAHRMIKYAASLTGLTQGEIVQMAVYNEITALEYAINEKRRSLQKSA